MGQPNLLGLLLGSDNNRLGQAGALGPSHRCCRGRCRVLAVCLMLLGCLMAAVLYPLVAVLAWDGF